jgi:hypothetical protein
MANDKSRGHQSAPMAIDSVNLANVPTVARSTNNARALSHLSPSLTEHVGHAARKVTQIATALTEPKAASKRLRTSSLSSVHKP